MKKTIAIVALLSIIILPIIASAQSGATKSKITDNSLVFKGYYQGAVQPADQGGGGQDDKTITLTFKDCNGQNINHNAQGGTSGTTVSVTNNNINNFGTIFTWTMEGKTTSTVSLEFIFSTFQAYVNEKYYRPEYTIRMLQTQTSATITTRTVVTRQYSSDNRNWYTVNSYGNPSTSSSTSTGFYDSDQFYSESSRIAAPEGAAETATETATKSGPVNSEFMETHSIKYTGALTGFGEQEPYYTNEYSEGRNKKTYYRTKNVETKSVSSWVRSGTCELNITDFEQKTPGTFRYVCWVIAEFTVE